MPKPKEMPTVTPYSDFPELVEVDFEALCQERLLMAEQKANAEARLKELNEEIAAALAIAGTKRAGYDHYVVTAVDGRSASQLKPALLLEHGVSADVIEACTTPGTSYTTVQFKDLNKDE